LIRVESGPEKRKAGLSTRLKKNYDQSNSRLKKRKGKERKSKERKEKKRKA
jgi:hypothetical protein